MLFQIELQSREHSLFGSGPDRESNIAYKNVRPSNVQSNIRSNVRSDKICAVGPMDGCPSSAGPSANNQTPTGGPADRHSDEGYEHGMDMVETRTIDTPIDVCLDRYVYGHVYGHVHGQQSVAPLHPFLKDFRRGTAPRSRGDAQAYTAHRYDFFVKQVGPVC